MSTENGAIVHASLRWPLFIDPQLQGLNWIRNMESSSSSSSSSITVISSATPHWIKLLNKCVTNGTTCVIEGLNGSIDPILLPLVSKNVIRKGRSLFVTIGSEEVLYDSQFKLFLHTQSSNPHFSPEVAAQCAIIDFTVTQVSLMSRILLKIIYALLLLFCFRATSFFLFAFSFSCNCTTSKT